MKIEHINNLNVVSNNSNIEPLTFERNFDIDNDFKSLKNDCFIVKLELSKKNPFFIAKNKFEYEKPKNMEQYVIWCYSFVPIQTILDHFSSFIDNKEFILLDNVNKCINVPHYHLMLRPTFFNAKLEKLIIVARHGPREPLYTIPSLPKWTKTGLLTKKGEQCCYDFGLLIKQFYEKHLDLSNVIVESSNTQRTIKSAEHFLKGLGLQDLYHNIQINPVLAGVIDEFNLIKPDITIESAYGCTINYDKDYYDIYSTIQCYKEEKGVDFKLEKIIQQYAENYYNCSFNKGYLPLKQYIDKLLKSDITFGYLSTHDSAIFSLAKSYKKINYRLPKFCSCIRIEKWSNCTRVYYDYELVTEFN